MMRLSGSLYVVGIKGSASCLKYICYIAICLMAACGQKNTNIDGLPTTQTSGLEYVKSELLLAPHRADNALQAPDYFKVEFICTNGRFVVEAKREWAPNGVDRFYNLVKNGYYVGNAFFRVVPNFIVQFGIHPDPVINKAWDAMMIPDDETLQSNVRGTLSYGTRGPNTRTTHLIINYQNNSTHLDPTNSVIARVIEGMSVVDTIYKGYGDLPQFGGKSPDPNRMSKEGYGFLKSNFPQLDYIEAVNLIED